MGEQYRGSVDPEMLIADLDGDQQRAVTSDGGLVAVIAGAGSGKTRVLTRRVAYRAAVGDADASHTLVLTFTREAAGELHRRLLRLGLNGRVTAGTFHSFAQRLLRQRWADLDQAPRTIVNDRVRIVRDLLGQRDVEAIVDEMNWATARGLDSDGYEAARRSGRSSPIEPARVAEALAAYRAEQRRRGIVDLDDLLSLANEALRRDPAFADATRWRHRHVLVDEAQDLNPLQHQLVDQLRIGVDDLFLVGDPAQAIYGFNGADPTILRDVESHFPGVEVFRLPTNHRSTPQIVEAGAHALRSGGQASDIRSGRAQGTRVDIMGHDDEHAEAASVASRIARLDPSLVRSGQVAVLARTHAALAPVRSALTERHVDVRRSVDGPGSPYAMPVATASRLADNTELRRWAFDQAEQSDDAVGAEVGIAVLDYLREQPSGDGPGFRTWVNANDPFGRDMPGVEVVTFHAAKGREWDTVFLVGVETGLVPHRSATTTAAKDEEARLAYVALTRATEVLAVNWAARRNGYQRKFSPLLAGFESEAAPVLPPPTELVGLPKTDRAVALDRLHEWRMAAARAGGILPDAVCTEQALGVIATHRPSNPDELDALTGWGPITSRRLFDPISEALTALDRP